jgi:hypothetical protein
MRAETLQRCGIDAQKYTNQLTGYRVFTGKSPRSTIANTNAHAPPTLCPMTHLPVSSPVTINRNVLLLGAARQLGLVALPCPSAARPVQCSPKTPGQKTPL